LHDNFETLGVHPVFVESLAGIGISKPLEIQKKTIPLLLQNKNLIFTSPTGTGKTYAYLLPFLGQMMDTTPKTPVFLIAAPTYELCSQIKNEADFLLEKTSLKSALLIGQTNLTRQIESLKKDAPAIVIGNPGRLLLLAKMGKLSLRQLKFVVFDEGDRLVSDELAEETRELAGLIKQKAAGNPVMAACSATFSPKFRERILPLMGEVKSIDCPGNLLREKIEHWAIYSEDRRKMDTLRSLIAALIPRNKKTSFKALVFTGRTGEIGKVVSRLQTGSIGATGISGDVKNQNRRQAMDDFRSGRVKLLVTSDLSARGLDIPDISHVIALDTGTSADAYLHRAGRTARAGKKGIMVTIGNESEMRRLASLEKKLGIVVHPKILYMGRITAPGNNDPS